MLKEKLVALIKSLPKNLRKHFVPVPQTVERCVEIEPQPVGSLYEWLASRLRKLTGEAVPGNAGTTDDLPNHLKMNFRVIDEKGKLLDYGRSLKNLQRKYSTEAGDSFDQLAAEELNCTGCIQWAFDDLPETYQFEQKGHVFAGFPAIIDEGDAVGVRIIDTEKKARILHRQGLVRLFQLHCRKEVKYLLKNIKTRPELELVYNQLQPHPVVSDDRKPMPYRGAVLFLIFDHVFTCGRNIRTQKRFDEVLNENKGKLASFTNEAGECALSILKNYKEIKSRLNKLPDQDPAVIGMREHLDCLVYKNFYLSTPYENLKSIPRYLKAVEYRLDKMAGEKKKDEQKMQELGRFWKRYWENVQKRMKSEPVIPEEEAFRWGLEELRVSLFAQQLKTAYPVSGKRLEKMWGEM